MRTTGQRGVITVDFLFAIVLILGMSSLMFVLTFSLSIASLVQYITYAAARNYTVAHIDRDQQEARAQAKYQELIGNPVIKPLLTNGWFSVDEQITIGDLTQVVPGWQEVAGDANEFWGAGTTFTAKVLDFQIPFFGSTTPDDADGQKGSSFKTFLSSMLGREPTEAECIEFTINRWNAIRNLQVNSGAAYSAGTSANGYYPMTDDGC